MSESFASAGHGLNPEKATSKQGVSVKATARLHMGFFDLNGELGRKFGSIGVSLDTPAYALRAYRAPQVTVAAAAGLNQHAAQAACTRASTLATKLLDALAIKQGLHIELTSLIPEHAGLGSGTQLSLAIGTAINSLYALQLDLRQLATITQRGARSGIGLGTFASGGVVVDGGRGSHTLIPPVLARLEFPQQWRIMLIFDRSHVGVHGEQEILAFKTLAHASAADADRLCRHVLMQALPALAEHDLPNFGQAIRELQQSTGDYFAPVQGGRYASQRTAAVLEWLQAQGVVCLGQSSWGPTGFAIFADSMTAESMLQRLRQQFAPQPGLEFMLCRGHNHGAEVRNIE